MDSVHSEKRVTRPAAQSPPNVAGTNHLLNLLPPADRDRLCSKMDRIQTRHGDLVYEPNKPISHIHFPLSGLISVVVEMEEGGIAEVGTIGNEGMTGVPVVLGADSTPNRAFYQIPGESMRISAGIFREQIVQARTLDNIMRLHAQGFLNQVSQSAACNRLHPVEQRLCRWILMSHDRVGKETIHLTQEFLAQMLGVRRASVSIVAATLQKAGFIRYRRGVIDVLNRPAIEEASCECYTVVRRAYERLLC